MCYDHDYLYGTDDGCFLGKIYVKGLSAKKLRELEQGTEDDIDLAHKLFLQF